MAGRRLRQAVRATLLEKGGSEFQDAHIIIAGLTGSYSQYITTFEEYEMQRYEVAFSWCLFSHIRLKGQPHLEHLIFETLRLAIASFGTGTINSHPSIVSLPTDK